ncbi:MAG: hypothetical protein IJB49_05465 [Clostridia bacterium]|nr:hypothetical protein [Clostridia bacterium]
MKRIYCLITVLALVVLLTSCAVEYKFAQETSDPEAFDLEIVNLEYGMGDVKGYEYRYSEENITVISKITNEEKEAFIAEFKQIKSYQPNFGSRIDVISGKAIRIIYPDGQIELITSWGTAVVTDGDMWVHTTTFEEEPFDALLEKYSKIQYITAEV